MAAGAVMCAATAHGIQCVHTGFARTPLGDACMWVYVRVFRFLDVCGDLGSSGINSIKGLIFNGVRDRCLLGFT